jgi:hypothetical protein
MRRAVLRLNFSARRAISGVISVCRTGVSLLLLPLLLLLLAVVVVDLASGLEAKFGVYLVAAGANAGTLCWTRAAMIRAENAEMDIEKKSDPLPEQNIVF